MLLKPYLDKVLTITADNRKEFSGHESIARQLNAAVYFVGARAERKHQWFDQTIFYKRQ